MRARLAFGAAVTFVVVAALVSALVGAADLNPIAVITAIISKIPLSHVKDSLTDTDQAVLFDIRLPRIVLGMLVGGLLAIAGAGYQGVFRNPLVDSGTLGASAGAGLGATMAIVYLGQAGPSTVPVAAFAGSVLGVAFAYVAGAAGGRGVATLLLAGIAVDMFFTAAQAFVLQQHTQDLQAVYTWLFGSLSANGWQPCLEILPYAAVSVTIILVHGRHLDVLSVGDEEARTLGLSPGQVRLIVVAAAALAAAAAVAVSGLIGFVGIVVPHVIRRLCGTSYRLVLPLSLLTGAGFLVLADTVGRTVLAPAELPIGVVTAFIGAPVFIWILHTTRSVQT